MSLSQHKTVNSVDRISNLEFYAQIRQNSHFTYTDSLPHHLILFNAALTSILSGSIGTLYGAYKLDIPVIYNVIRKKGIDGIKYGFFAGSSIGVISGSLSLADSLGYNHWNTYVIVPAFEGLRVSIKYGILTGLSASLITTGIMSPSSIYNRLVNNFNSSNQFWEGFNNAYNAGKPQFNAFIAKLRFSDFETHIVNLKQMQIDLKELLSLNTLDEAKSKNIIAYLKMSKCVLKTAEPILSNMSKRNFRI